MEGKFRAAPRTRQTWAITSRQVHACGARRPPVGVGTEAKKKKERENGEEAEKWGWPTQAKLRKATEGNEQETIHCTGRAFQVSLKNCRRSRLTSCSSEAFEGISTVCLSFVVSFGGSVDSVGRSVCRIFPEAFQHGKMKLTRAVMSDEWSRRRRRRRQPKKQQPATSMSILYRRKPELDRKNHMTETVREN